MHLHLHLHLYTYIYTYTYNHTYIRGEGADWSDLADTDNMDSMEYRQEPDLVASLPMSLVYVQKAPRPDGGKGTTHPYDVVIRVYIH